MSQKDYYELLGIQPSASAEVIKQAFREQVSRYHPDKVQHLGKEFQEIAAGRTAELTAAYHVLSDESRRSEYDRTRRAAAAVLAAEPRQTPPRTESEPAAAEPPDARSGAAFSHERASRDEFVRKVTISRFRHELELATHGSYEESEARGFDFARVPRSTLFGRAKGPRFVGRFVSQVNGEAVADTWVRADRLGAQAGEGVCVFLIGSVLASRRELEEAVTQRRRRRARGGAITLVPVDARNWEAYVPVDAPPIAKALLDRLKAGG
jgi:curved DNA-binding protein CbpA